MEETTRKSQKNKLVSQENKSVGYSFPQSANSSLSGSDWTTKPAGHLAGSPGMTLDFTLSFICCRKSWGRLM